MYQEINLYVPRTMHRSKLPNNLVIKLFNDLIGQPLKAIFQRWFIRGIIPISREKANISAIQMRNEKALLKSKHQFPIVCLY